MNTLRMLMEDERNQVLSYLKNEIKKYETESRYLHSYSVYEEATKLSQLFCMNDEDSFALKKAAIIHDITKDFSGEEQLKLCDKYGIKTNKKPSDPMPIMHQDTGCLFAREVFGNEIVDDKVFSAVGCHTTGKLGMNLIDKLLYLADFIEPKREHASCKELRQFFYDRCKEVKNTEELLKILDESILFSLQSTLNHLTQRKREIDDRIIPLWNSLINSEE